MNMTIVEDDIEQIKAIVTDVYPTARLGRTTYQGEYYVGITAVIDGQVIMLTDFITLDHKDEEYEFAVWANAAEKLIGRA
jgi:hypothetical protein